jgi:hypothetical protein
MKASEYPFVSPLARFIWRTSERYGIPLGRLAPFIFGLAIGRWPKRLKNKP